MKIAFTHNLQTAPTEAEAEFDTAATVAMITSGLEDLGHEVVPIDVAGPLAALVERLETCAPDLVFNTAEGSHGRFREAFYPALFEQLDLAFTGSNAAVCAVTLDKQWTKQLVAARGVPTPRAHHADAESGADLRGFDLRFPVIIKPNFEGSSIGITPDSVCDSLPELAHKLPAAVARFPAGVLVEEFIVGRDVAVPYLEGASPETGGVLEPASYRYTDAASAGRTHVFYDFDLKTLGFDPLTVEVPATITSAQRDRVIELSATVFGCLGVRDVGRIDFRLDADGEPYFLEVNALPSLERGASIYEAGRLIGLDTTASVLDRIVESARSRFHGENQPNRVPAALEPAARRCHTRAR